VSFVAYCVLIVCLLCVLCVLLFFCLLGRIVLIVLDVYMELYIFIHCMSIFLVLFFTCCIYQTSYRDFVQQIYLPNCALCVLSRFGATDDIWDVKGTESNFEFIESVHFAGATCVMYPLWGGLTQGSLGALGNTLMLIK